MKTNRLTMTILFLIVSMTAILPAAEEETRSNTRHAQTLLQIYGDTAMYTGMDLNDLLSTLGYESVRKILHTTDGVDVGRSVKHRNRNIAACNLSINIRNDELSAVADEILHKTIRQVEVILITAYEAYKTDLQDKTAMLEKRTVENQAELKALEAQMLELSDGRQMERDCLEAEITDLSYDLDKARFGVQVTMARMREVQKQLDEAKERQLIMTAEDPIMQQLQNRLKLFEKQLENIKKRFSGGLVPETDVMEIEQQLIDARIELAEREEMLQDKPAGTKVLEAEERLTDLSLEQSEQEMHLSFLDEQICRRRDLLTHSTEYETLRIKADILRDTLYESMENLEANRQHLAALTPPNIIILSE